MYNNDVCVLSDMVEHCFHPTYGDIRDRCTHINKTHKYVREGGKVQGGLVDILTSSSSCRHCMPRAILKLHIGMQFPYPKVSLKC